MVKKTGSTNEHKCAGHYEKGRSYNFFVPTKINDEWEFHNMEIFKLQEKAAVRLGELNSFSKLTPSIELFLQSYVTNEAVLSSKIEGTRTNKGTTALFLFKKYLDIFSAMQA